MDHTELSESCVLKRTDKFTFPFSHPLKVINLGASWLDLDLCLFYKRKDGRSGGIFPSEYRNCKTDTGSIDHFPYMYLYGESLPSDGDSEVAIINRVDEIDEIFVCIINYNATIEGEEDFLFSQDVCRLEIRNSEGINVNVLPEPIHSGCICLLCTIKNRDNEITLKNESKAISVSSAFEKIPGFEQIIRIPKNNSNDIIRKGPKHRSDEEVNALTAYPDRIDPEAVMRRDSAIDDAVNDANRPNTSQRNDISVRSRIIKELNALYKENANGCNEILEGISLEYDEYAQSSKDFLKSIKCSPLYWESRINFYGKENTLAPFQLFEFIYSEEEGIIGGGASCYLTGPPDPYEMIIDEIPNSVLMAVLNKLTNHNNNHMSQKQVYVGLTDAEVLESRRKNGVNILTPPEKDPWWKEFLGKFSDPLIIILLVAGVLSIGISLYEFFGLEQNWKVFFEPIGIFVAIGLATTLAFIFEQRANKAFKILNQVNDDELVEVIRNSVTTTIPRKDVVVGDIVIINTGDEIPADGELLDAVTLGVDESTLTGEPLCYKTTDPAHFDKEATYPSNHVMRGTKVMEGHGVMRVLKVGDATEMGKVFEEAQIDDSVKTPLNEQLDGLADWITNVSYGFAGLIIVGQLIHFLGWINWQAWTLIVPVALFFWLVIKKFEDWSKAKCILTIIGFFVLFFAMVIGAFAMIHTGADSATWSLLLAHTLKTLMVAVTLIVVAVPEGLPMAVTLSLAYSMSRMLKTNNLVRKMHACETMGATTIICTDKTGTLTQNQMQVYKTNFFGKPSDEILYEGIAVNSTAQLDLTGDKPQVLGNPTEGALLLWLKEHNADYKALRMNATRIEELPFTTERKYMATVVKSATGKNIFYVKGAPEIIFAMCKNTCDVSKQEIDAQLLAYQNQAMRTLGFAYQELGDKDATIENGKVVADKLTFLGIVAISDPVRLDVPDAVNEVIAAGVKVKIVTGDTPGTAKEIGRQIGLWNDATDTDRNIITGVEFSELSDAQLRERVGELKIIARARPLDKKRLVEALQANNEVVAVTGDGTNDAPALKTAHVGLSMGDGTSVAKEASDITIIDNSFSSIGRAVMWGRSLYKNIQRFLLFQLTVNVAACFLVLFGSFMGTESPLTVTQMLWVNLIMDTFGAMALASLPPSPSVMNDKPRCREASILTRSMMTELLGVGLFFFALTLGFYWLFNHAEVTSITQMFSAVVGDENPMTAYEATLLFSIFVWTHFWYMFDARVFETGESVFKVKMSSGFWTIVVIIVIGQLFITEIAYEFFNVEPMLHTLDWHFNPTGAIDLLIIVGVSSLVLWIREVWYAITK